MAGKVFEIAFNLAGQLQGSFSKTFDTASKALSGFSGSLNEINAQAAKIDKIVGLRQEMEASRKEYLQNKIALDRAREAMAKTEQPTEGLKQKVALLEKQTEQSRKAFERKKASLNEVEDKLGTAGVATSKLVAEQKRLEEQAEKSARALERMAKATELQGKLKGYISESTVALGGLAAAAAPVGFAIKSAMNFEDSRAELGKYTDDAEGVFNGIIELTKKYGKSATDMTDMATNAMQSGIAKTKEEVLTLVESQTQAAVALGMTGDQVGEAWADIQGKMGMNVKQTQEVMDIINQLGNTTKSSSTDIIEVLQRQGGTLHSLTALGQKEITALAGAFRNASTSNEVAATSMGTFISRLTVGHAATKAQTEAFETLGLDAEDMAKRMTSSSESAQEALQDVFKRINGLSADKQGAVIGQLFGNEAGIKAAVAGLAKNTEWLSNNFKVVGDSANYSGSMFTEYMNRANTTSEAMAIFKNQMTLISANLGTALLPSVKSITKELTALATKVANFVSENQGVILKVAKVAAVIGGAVAAFHILRIAISATIYPFVSLYKAINWFTIAENKAKVAIVAKKVAMVAQKAAMLAWKGICVACTAVQWAWNAALNANPIGLVVIAIAALIAIGIAVWKNWDKIKTFFVNAFNAIKTKVMELWASFQQKFPMISRIVQIATLPIQIAIQSVIIVFKLLKAAGIALWSGLKWCWNAIKSATVAGWNKIKEPLINAWNKFKEFGAWIGGVFKDAFVSAWTGIRDKVAGVFGGLVDVIKGPMNAVISLVNKAIGKINSISIDLPAWAGGGHIGFDIPEIPMLASGGIATAPTLAMIGEGSESEAVLPLSKLEGMLNGGVSGAGGGISINFAPVINVSGGGASAYDSVKRGLEEGQRNLKRELEKLLRDQRRLSYA